MKRLVFLSFSFLFVICACQPNSEQEPEYTGRIIQETCGGTVIQFISYDYGEDWINFFKNSEKLENVVLTGDLSKKGIKEGDNLNFDFKRVNGLGGNICNIGGLPSIKIAIFNISFKLKN